MADNQDQALINRAAHLKALKASEGGKLLMAYLQDQKDELVRQIFAAHDDGKGNTAETKHLVLKAKAFDEIKEFVESGIRYGEQELSKS